MSRSTPRGDRVPPARHRVWTVQPELVWRRLEQQERLLVDSHRNRHLHHAYDWLAGRLQQLLPGYGDGYPWWAYGQRPDLRAIRHNKPLGQDFVLIELDLPASRVITFPAWAWDDVYYGRLLSYRRAIATDWRRRLLAAVPQVEELPTLPQPWLGELEASWEQLFSGGLSARSRGETRSRCGWEAVFKVLALEDVRGVRMFAGASRARGGIA